MKVSVLVPFRPDAGHRDRLRNFTYLRIVETILPYQIPEVLFFSDGDEDPELFNHGKAINACAREATGDVFLIMDADTTHDGGTWLSAALAQTGKDRKWRLPAKYYQLTESATDDVLQGYVAPERLMPGHIEWTGHGVSWSGLVIVPREAFELVGGADERYIGWGADDVALGQALDTLYGEHERYPGAAVHLWHPRGEQEQGLHRYSVGQRELTEEYDRASGDPEAMSWILAEKPPWR